ncbi:DoxX family protein [Pararhizobium mangrovi]|uniref:DoxX family protein n=1 Tax=Pararhizobium mangrovi TaxID=2590452 RepID=A0A506U0V9_9HYPH|nr:DoxX family protein [Pararhizobium mangrovi]TPW26585.1 DoxX family protein [Pararhizobium mangrovi]
MNNAILLLGRILLAVLFIPAGFSKLVAVSGVTQYFAGLGIPAPALTIWLVIALELLGGLAVLLGVLTRPAAFALAVFSAAAGYLGHYGHGDTAQLVQMNQQAFMKDLAIAGGFLVLGVFGPGRFAVGRFFGAGRNGSYPLA